MTFKDFEQRYENRPVWHRIHRGDRVASAISIVGGILVSALIIAIAWAWRK